MICNFFHYFWTIQKERNLHIFCESSSFVKDLKDLIYLRIGWWINEWNENFPYSSNEVMRNPLCLQWNGSDARYISVPISKIPVSWNSPNNNTLKWNVDASVNPIESCSVIGGVLRDHKGNFMCIFHIPCPLWR